MENKEEKEVSRKPYKIQIGDIIKIHREKKTKNGRSYMFYKTYVEKNNYDGTTILGEKIIRFKTGVEVKNNALILVKDMFEDFWKDPREKFKPTIWSIFILDFELVEKGTDDTPQDERNLNEYNKKISEINMDDIEEFMNDDLPF